MKIIKSINLEIINICNLKCSICDIWKNKNKNILNLDDIKNIISSKFISKKTNITLTGGEPFLNKDIFKITKEINKNGLKVNTISTNGILYKNIDNFLSLCKKNNIPIPNIHISIDGLEKNHDIQRGIIGSFKKSINTIIKLRKKFNGIKIKLKYTIIKNNISDIKKTFLLSKKIGVDISYKIVENDSNYTNNINIPSLLELSDKLKIIKILKGIYKEKNLYINNLMYYLKTDKLNFICSTPENVLFIMANGKVFSCTKYNEIGNIKNQNIDNIVYNQKHINIIDLVKKNKCSKCFSLHGSYKTIINAKS